MTVIKNKTAYSFFCEHTRPFMVKNHPKLAKSEILAKIRANWKIVKIDKKKVQQYVDMAIEDKARYLAEMKSYNQNDIPKKNKTAYVFFCQAIKPVIKEKRSQLSKSEIVKLAIRLWKKIKMNKIKLQKYIDMATEDKARYIEEMKIYNESKMPINESPSSPPPHVNALQEKSFFRIIPFYGSISDRDEENYYYFTKNASIFCVRKCYQEFV